MRGLSHYPTYNDRERCLHSIQTETDIPLKRLCTYLNWARIEPRIAETLVTYLGKYWAVISPLELNKHIQNTPWPACLGLILEFVKISIPQSHLWRFNHWRSLVMADIPPANNEQYFIGLRKFAGKEMLKDVTESTKPYLRWGYFGRDQLSRRPRAASLLSKETRKQILSDYLYNHRQIAVSDYILLLNFQIHPRTAQRDLENHPKLKKIGNTKGCVYVRKKSG